MSLIWCYRDVEMLLDKAYGGDFEEKRKELMGTKVKITLCIPIHLGI